MSGMGRIAQFAGKVALVWVAVAAPVSVTVTARFAVNVFVGTQRTLIVQLPAGLTTAPSVQLPPGWIEAVPVPVPLTFAMLGGTVDESVNGPLPVF
jgi:hypothetical protein